MAPGEQPASITFNDFVGGGIETFRAGLAVFRIAYSDHSEGHLAVSCTLDSSPPSIHEGITVSKGFVNYTNREAPTANENFTVFHVL